LEEGKSSYRGRSWEAKACTEKSAEVIVVTENEPASERNTESRRSHKRNEGLNVKKFFNATWIFSNEIACSKRNRAKER